MSEAVAGDADAFKADVKAQLREVDWAPVICTTASRGRRVQEVLAAILAAGEQHRRRVPTATLNMVLREAVAWKAPPSQRGSGRQGRIYYATQAGSSPPSFVLFVNDPRLFSADYRRCALPCVCVCVCALTGRALAVVIAARRSISPPPCPSSLETHTYTHTKQHLNACACRGQHAGTWSALCARTWALKAAPSGCT